MTQRVKIKVEQRHIDKGGTDSSCCPVYHAMRDAGIACEFHVYRDEITFYGEFFDPRRISVPTSQVVEDFIETNDEDEERPEPIEFELDLPDGVTLTPQGPSAEST